MGNLGGMTGMGLNATCVCIQKLVGWDSKYNLSEGQEGQVMKIRRQKLWAACCLLVCRWKMRPWHWSDGNSESLLGLKGNCIIMKQPSNTFFQNCGSLHHSGFIDLKRGPCSGAPHSSLNGPPRRARKAQLPPEHQPNASHSSFQSPGASGEKRPSKPSHLPAMVNWMDNCRQGLWWASCSLMALGHQLDHESNPTKA